VQPGSCTTLRTPLAYRWRTLTFAAAPPPQPAHLCLFRLQHFLPALHARTLLPRTRLPRHHKNNKKTRLRTRCARGIYHAEGGGPHQNIMDIRSWTTALRSPYSTSLLPSFSVDCHFGTHQRTVPTARHARTPRIRCSTPLPTLPAAVLSLQRLWAFWTEHAHITPRWQLLASGRTSTRALPTPPTPLPAWAGTTLPYLAPCTTVASTPPYRTLVLRRRVFLRIPAVYHLDSSSNSWYDMPRTAAHAQHT